MAFVYSSIEGERQVTTDSWVDIDGLKLTLPRRLGTLTAALVTLNVPRPYAKGSDFPAVAFAVAANGVTVAIGEISYNQKEPESFGRIPLTIVCKVDLQDETTIEVKGQWRQSRNSTGIIDSFASLSAVLS